MTDHQATPEQWADAGAFASGTRACILELRARVEALEEAENDRRFETAKALIDKPASAPAGSLVDRVALAISRCEDSSCWDDEAVNWSPEACAAIRVIAGELRAQCFVQAADWLDQGANPTSQED
jgi:hypothetical protein